MQQHVNKLSISEKTLSIVTSVIHILISIIWNKNIWIINTIVNGLRILLIKNTFIDVLLEL